MSETTPDLEGYAAAQERLRKKFGQEVTFLIPQPTIWPEGVPVDSQGQPLDPTVAPLASGYASAAVTCSVASRPARGSLSAPVETTQLGIHEANSLLLAAGKADFDAAELDSATRAEVFDATYKIEATQPDQIGPGEIQRMLIFVEKM